MGIINQRGFSYPVSIFRSDQVGGGSVEMSVAPSQHPSSNQPEEETSACLGSAGRGSWGASLLLATATVVLGLSMSAANAAPIICGGGCTEIVPNGNPGGVQATAEPVLDGGPGFPLNLFGYTSNAVLEFNHTDFFGNPSGGTIFQFTFEGAGNTACYKHVYTRGPHVHSGRPWRYGRRPTAPGAGKKQAGSKSQPLDSGWKLFPFGRSD